MWMPDVLMMVMSYVRCGMVVRDNLGNVIIFSATKLDKLQGSPTLAERLALRWWQLVPWPVHCGIRL
jgi:hypothetical protein